VNEKQRSSVSPKSRGPRRRRVRTWQVVALWLIGMAPLVLWGLPTSRYDPFLFGGDEPWSADRYQAGRALQARRERIAGADTDLDPLVATDRIVDLTEDEAARGAILLRYRLYSRQPDEMITFMALQRMDPARLDLDPQLYQYGGGYIYLIGVALGISSLLGLINVTSDVGVYLSEPELFARFYVAARLVTLVFGALTLVASIKLARRAAGRTAGWIAFALVAASPVFISSVLEAKPHLLSVCLLLWAILSALDYQAHSRRRDVVRMGLQVGYAFGMVLTGLIGALLWPVLLLLRRTQARRTLLDLAVAGVVALAVYALTNPYIPYNLLFDRAALASNIANSTAMYSIERIPEGFLRVGQLLLESCGPGVLLGGLIALAWLYVRWPRQADLVSTPGIAMLLLCIAIGAGKPAEFGRFLLLPAILFAIGTAALVASVAVRRPGWAVLAAIVVLAVMRTPAYVYSFYADARFEHESRHRAAQYLREHAGPDDIIGVVQEPAPYATPPLDFAHRTICLLSHGNIRRIEYDRLPEWIVLTADDATVHRAAWWQGHYRLVEQFAAKPFQLSRIAWANKPVFIYRRAEPGAR
jgi:hypothetical protein